ncbi:MAG: hypothetical protein IKB81_04010 [Paludibacteraceae bacterium]|nr:hypothetical protein [Paludibacteraceae bacterium]
MAKNNSTKAETTKVAGSTAKTISPEVKKLMERYDVDVIYRNSRGEFFLQKDLAVNSEAGKADKVETFKK